MSLAPVAYWAISGDILVSSQVVKLKSGTVVTIPAAQTVTTKVVANVNPKVDPPQKHRANSYYALQGFSPPLPPELEQGFTEPNTRWVTVYYFDGVDTWLPFAATPSGPAYLLDDDTVTITWQTAAAASAPPGS